MNRAGVLESSHLVAAGGNPNWWSTVSGGGLMRPPPPPPQQISPSSFLRPPPLPQYLPSPSSSSSSSSSSWPDSYDLPPESWSLSQLLLGGLMMGEEERMEMMSNINNYSFQGKKLENWEEQVLLMSHHHQANSMAVVDHVKQENHNNNNNGNNHSNNYHVMSPKSPPNNNNSKSCVTTTTTTNTTTSLNSSGNNSMLDFSTHHHHHKPDGPRHPPPNPAHHHECHSSETGGSANKKPRLQASPPSTQSTLKVRKEKLGGRIAALHQLVSPFGKTDTASVLSEAIGYIRFLQSQIEALSLPYFGAASGNMRHQQHVQGDRNCIFPEDPGQLVKEQHYMKRRGVSSSCSDNIQNSNSNEESKKDLKSRGLCLVPISCTLQVGSENGADYWAPSLGASFR